MGKNPFSPFRQLDSVCCQQARCCVNFPMIKETKISSTAPVSEPPVHQVSFPVPFSVLSCQWWDWGKHLLCYLILQPIGPVPWTPFWWPWDFSPQSHHRQPAVPTAVIIRGPHQTRQLPSNISNLCPRKAADSSLSISLGETKKEKAVRGLGGILSMVQVTAAPLTTSQGI